MTGRENYAKTIEFGGPDYVPCCIDVDLDWLYEKDAGKSEVILELRSQVRDDILCAFEAAGTRMDLRADNGNTQWNDEWGTGWLDDGFGAKTVIHPLSGGYDLMDEYAFPDPFLKGRFDESDTLLVNRGDRYVRPSVWFTLFERMWMLRGFENILIDPYLYEKEFAYLRDKIVDYDLAMIDQWLDRGVDGIFISDDWGSQRDLLINPDDWRRLYRDCYKKLFERIRSRGKHVWMHLCGNVISIIPDLLDLGLNVLNPVQPQAMDLDFLGENFGGNLCFYGGVDVQGTLVQGSVQEVKDSVKKLIDTFGSFNGGYIGGTSHSIMPETPLDNVMAMYETFLEYQ